MPNPLEKAVEKVKDQVKPEHPEHPEHLEHATFVEVPVEGDPGEGGVSVPGKALLDLDCVVAVERDGEGSLFHLGSGHSIYSSLPYVEAVALLLDGDEEAV